MEEQDGSCQRDCERIVLEASNLNNGDPDGPWRCENAVLVEHGLKPDGACVHGSIVYFNGGPSDYTAQLTGTQTSRGCFSIPLWGTECRQATSNVDGIISFGTADRSLGCAAGCEMTVTELALVVAPFSIPGFTILGFGWDGLSMDTSLVINQGMLRGRVYDDGRFELDAGHGSLVVEYEGDVTDRWSKVLDRQLTGTIDFENNAVTFDGLELSQGEGTVQIGNLFGGAVRTPPRPAIATPELHECRSLDSTPVQLDPTGTFDLEGGPLTYRWDVDGVLVSTEQGPIVEMTYGSHELKLTVSDSTLGRGIVRRGIEIVDTTPPLWGESPRLELTACDDSLDTQVLEIPPVTDDCTGVAEVEAWLVAANGQTLAEPLALDIEAAALPAGDSTVLWVARDAVGNESTIQQTAWVGPAIQAFDRFEVSPDVVISNASGAMATLGSLGSQRTTLGVRSQVGELRSVGPVLLDNRASVTGRVVSEDAIRLANFATAGSVEPFSPANLHPLPWTAEVEAGGFGDGELVVLPGEVRWLAGAVHGRIAVRPGARLVLTEPEVRVQYLELHPDSVLELAAEVERVVARDGMAVHGAVVGHGASRPRFYALGGEVQIHRPIEGVDWIAPQANLVLGPFSSGARFGLLVGNLVRMSPKHQIFCDRNARLAAP